MRKTLVAAMLAAPVLALAGCGEQANQDASHGDHPPAATSAPASPAAPATETEQAEQDDVQRFTVEGGKRTKGPDRIEVGAGDTVTIEVTSDTADELHVHGYDEVLELTPGEQATLEFTADIPGVFEIELHGSGGLVAQLRVTQ
ncbi:MAG: hypothetical protein ACRDQ7_24340 [Haloechinothrix sp.]